MCGTHASYNRFQPNGLSCSAPSVVKNFHTVHFWAFSWLGLQVSPAVSPSMSLSNTWKIKLRLFGRSHNPLSPLKIKPPV